jgi:hypothetical protein
VSCRTGQANGSPLDDGRRDGFGVQTMDLELDHLLADAAKQSVEHDIDLDDFMKAAWNAYVEARPGFRDRLEYLRMVAELDTLRKLGRVGQA